MPLIVRPARAADEDLLREMLRLAVFVPEGGAPPPASAIEAEPRLSALVRGFGEGECDQGSIAEDDGRVVGAAWLRLAPDGYGFVADDVPELSMAVVPERRGTGVGGALLSALLAGVERVVPGVSLSCDDRNPAIRLYQRFDFEQVRFEPPHTVVMLRRFEPDPLTSVVPTLLP
jgi:GNAT superfamily N-acetyltransferase